MTHNNIPASPCPACGKVCDMATEYDNGPAPVPGDFSICLECQNVNRFDGDLRLRQMTDEERVELDKDPETRNEIEKYRSAIVLAKTGYLFREQAKKPAGANCRYN